MKHKFPKKTKLFISVVENENTRKGDCQFKTDTFIGKYTTPIELTEKYIDHLWM